MELNSKADPFEPSCAPDGGRYDGSLEMIG